MKNIVIILGLLLSCSCASLSTQTQPNAIIVECNEDKVEFYTKVFAEADSISKTQRKHVELVLVPDFNEKDYRGEVVEMLKNNMSKSNLEKLLDHRTLFTIGFVVDQEENRYGKYACIRNRNAQDLRLSQNEMQSILDYADNIVFRFKEKYSGEFKRRFGASFNVTIKSED